MKKCLVILLLVIAGSLYAQEQETLLSGDVHLSGFGGPVVKFTSINKEFAVMVGGYGGLLINHSFLIGLGGYGLVNNLEPNQTAIDYFGIVRKSRIEFGYGGGVLEYIGNPGRIVHYTVTALIGAGGVTYRERYDHDFDFGQYDANTETVFASELSAAVELNITTFFRMDVGAGYRFISGVNLVGLKNEDLSGPSANITFKFGAF